MRNSSLYSLRSTDPAPPPSHSPPYDPIVEFLKMDLRRARWLLSKHIPYRNGWCSHQGAYEQFRWPCQLFQCAQDAIIAGAAFQGRPVPLLSKARSR